MQNKVNIDNKVKPVIPITPIGKRTLFTVLGIAIITFLCFIPVLSNQFLYWDDNVYIVGEPHIRRFSWENIRYLFTHEFGANWQPLTMLSYSVNYYFSKLSPSGYFFTNLLLHLLNTALVFFVIKNLVISIHSSSQSNEAWFVGGIVSLWFGIHPMHVESVSWLFERKDVLYTFFYLAALLTYIKYINTNKLKWYAFVFLLFVASCCSKPMAVVFPGSIILIDLFLNRRNVINIVVEKIPFLIGSLFIGYYTILTQKSEHAFAFAFSLLERFQIASYTIMAYIGKLFLPVNLCSFYPYPIMPGGTLPWIFFLTPFIFLAVIAFPLFYTYKKDKQWFRTLLFGFGFYLVNIALVMQFFPVGFAIISDRYSYISYIGLFFILARLLNELLQRFSAPWQNAIMIFTALYSVIFGVLCYMRATVWNNTGTLLNDVINKYPEKVPAAYKYLGIYYAKAGMTDEAYHCYDILVNKMHEKDAGAYCNIGSIFMAKKDYNKAMQYLNESINIDSNTFEAYRNRGIIYEMNGNYDMAFKDYYKAMKIYPLDEGLYSNLSYAHMETKQYREAINDYNMLIRFDPDNSINYFNRGVAEFTLNDTNDALDDFTRTYTMPALKENMAFNLNAKAAFNMSVIYKDRKDLSKADYYSREALRLGYRGN